MFIIRYMSGVVDEDNSGQDDNGFDPHEHRNIPHATTYSDTMMHMLKGSIGAGILAMPVAVKGLGVLNSIIGLFVIGLFASYCILLLIKLQYKLCKRWKRGYMAYPKSMKLAIQDGPACFRCAAKFCYWFVDSTLIMWQLGIGTIYFVFVAENLQQVFSQHDIHMSLRLLLCYELPPTIIVNLVKNLKLMTPMSAISNITITFGLILVFFYLVEDDLELKPEMNEMKGIIQIPLYIGTALFALEAVGVILALEYNMEKPKQFGGMCGVFTLGMIIIIGLYLLVGVFGYLKYGNDIKDSITLNLPPDQKKAQAAKILFAFAIFLSFPLQNFVAYNIIWRKLQKKIPAHRQCVIDYTLRVVLVVIPWLLAIAVPKIGGLIALFGALCLSLLAMVFPGIMDLCLYYSDPKGYGPLRFRLIRAMFIIIVGSAVLISGVYASTLDLMKGGGGH